MKRNENGVVGEAGKGKIMFFWKEKRMDGYESLDVRFDLVWTVGVARSLFFSGP